MSEAKNVMVHFMEELNAGAFDMGKCPEIDMPMNSAFIENQIESYSRLLKSEIIEEVCSP